MNNQNLLYLESFLEMLIAERSAAKNTLLSYKKDIHDLHLFSETKGIDFLEFSRNDLEDFVSDLSKKRLSAKSLSRKISAIRQFYAFLISENYITKNPALDLDLPRQPRSIPKALYSEQIEQLLSFAHLDKTPEGLRSAVIIELLYSTGLRISELISIKLSDLRNINKATEDLFTMIIKGKGGKERMIIINASATNSLNAYLKIRPIFAKDRNNDYLFPSQSRSGKSYLSRQRCFQLLKKMAISVGISPDIVSPHKIRHSFATHLLRGGANLREVQELLGHSDISSTQIYTKVANDKARDLVINHHPIARKKHAQNTKPYS